MASIILKRGTREEIENTSVSDGQLLIETDQGSYNKIYIDTENNERVVVGGSTNDIVQSLIEDMNDLCVGIDDTTYESAGVAVRTQITKVNTILNNLLAKLVEKGTITEEESQGIIQGV